MQPRVQRPFKTAAQRIGALLSSPGGVRARAELRRALSDADGLSPERPNWEPSNPTAMPLQVSPLHGRRHSADPHRCPGEVLRPSPASQTRQELQPPPAGLWSPRLGPVGCSLQGCAAALALAACWLSAVALVPDRTVRAQMLATPPAPASHGAAPPPKTKSSPGPAAATPNPNQPAAIDKGGLLPPPCPLIVPPQLPALQPIRIQPSQVAAKNRMGCLSAADAVYGPDGCPLRLCPASSGAFPADKSR